MEPTQSEEPPSVAEAKATAHEILALSVKVLKAFSNCSLGDQFERTLKVPAIPATPPRRSLFKRPPQPHFEQVTAWEIKTPVSENPRKRLFIGSKGELYLQVTQPTTSTPQQLDLDTLIATGLDELRGMKTALTMQRDQLRIIDEGVSGSRQLAKVHLEERARRNQLDYN
jgi:hypothetical protein